MSYTPSQERQLRQDIVAVCKLIYQQGWLAASDGNVSVKLDDDRILATPTAIHKGLRMREEDLLVLDSSGRRIEGTREASSEFKMHLAAYQERPQVRAVVHAHPTNCIAASLAGLSLAQCLLPETVFTFGAIPTTAYSTPTTEEVPREVRKWIRQFDALILDRHGSLTVGRDLAEAYDKLERMEHVAEITIRARMLGPLRPLSAEQIARLQQVGESLGLPKRPLQATPCEHCNACPGRGAQRAGGESGTDEMIRRVQESVDRSLRK